MSTTLSVTLFMKLLAYFSLVNSFQANTDVHVSKEERNWAEARSLCKETNGNNDVLSRCQPENCKPYSLNRTIPAMEVDNVYWLGGYVLRSRIMEYKGCYQLTENYGTIKLVNNLPLEDNPIIQCSTFCNDTKDGDVMLFTNTSCYCVKGKVYKEWKQLNTLTQISSDRCNYKCPGDKHNLCGSDNNTTVVSCYTYKPLNPDPIFYTVGKFCFYVDELKQINYTECSRLLKFKCQKISSVNRKWDFKCYHYGLSWYDARKACEQDKRVLQIYTDNQCVNINFNEGETTWHNRFVNAKIIWNKDDPTEDSCLALLVTSKGQYELVTRDCNQNHTTLCRKTSETSTVSKKYTESTVNSESNMDKSDIKKTFTENNEGPLIGGAIGGLSGIVFLVVVIVFIVKRNHLCIQDKQPTNLSVYYSTVADNDKAILVPNPPQTTSEYIYVEESDIKRPPNDHSEDTYNILNEDERRRQDNTSGPIYDHSGVKDGDYDLTNMSNDRLDDNVHSVYDDSRTLENVYDETVHGKVTYDNMITSIYDHA